MKIVFLFLENSKLPPKIVCIFRVSFGKYFWTCLGAHQDRRGNERRQLSQNHTSKHDRRRARPSSHIRAGHVSQPRASTLRAKGPQTNGVATVGTAGRRRTPRESGRWSRPRAFGSARRWRQLRSSVSASPCYGGTVRSRSPGCCGMVERRRVGRGDDAVCRGA